MNDVVGSHQETNLLVGGQHQRIVHLQQIVFALGFKVVDLCLRRSQFAVVADVRFEILIVPLPLRGGNKDGEACITVVFDVYQRLRRRDGDADQDQGRNQGPEDFDHRALVKISGLRMPRAPMGKDRVEHDAEDNDPDNHANPKTQVVQPLDALTHFRDAFP